jgi:hypothetical protein
MVRRLLVLTGKRVRNVSAFALFGSWIIENFNDWKEGTSASFRIKPKSRTYLVLLYCLQSTRLVQRSLEQDLVGRILLVVERIRAMLR